MCYGRSKFKRRRFIRRYKKTGTRFMARAVKRTMYRQSETKFFIVNVNSTITNAANYESGWANGINQGTGNEQRIGNQIAVKNIGFNFTFNFNTGNSGASGSFVRVLVVWPRKGVSTTSLIGYFTGTNPGIAARPDPKLMLTLYDQKFMLAANTAGNGLAFKTCRFTKYCKMAKWNYDSNGICDSQPVVYFATDASAVTTANISIRGYATISYKDV
ncbi:putative capsid protein [Odonata-associated circular virus-2]|uniref:putative capsid protein n=1 Tax=Odonata-associated circular virus-2 TaxID=1592120 RepID=UPI0005861ADE|nr:putative capsid protein [Odonata-associated circular virus-2]AJD07488.1 putative capsid protein [Odonata-associated circular virus-2]